MSLVDVVVPATRPRLLQRLLSRLDGLPGQVVVVDGGGHSPAAARNAGWRGSTAEWIAFLDDDVVPTEGWAAQLVRDLERAHPAVAGSQGHVEVPLALERRPTDWERSVRGLEDARWATADMAYRRSVLSELGGFDERFPRAYREDADLALRATRAGYELARGERRVLHPVEPAGWLVSVRKQAGNADDVLMRAKHGPGWRRQSEECHGQQERRVDGKSRHFVPQGAGGESAASQRVSTPGITPSRASRRCTRSSTLHSVVFATLQRSSIFWATSGFVTCPER